MQPQLAEAERMNLRLAIGRADVDRGWAHIEAMANKAAEDFAAGSSNVVTVPETTKVALLLEVFAMAYRMPPTPSGIDGVEFDFPEDGGMKAWWTDLVRGTRRARDGLPFVFNWPTKRKVIG